MNVRKPVDYSSLYTAIDTLLEQDLSQMKLYYEIGRQICARAEKGAAVAAAEYLQAACPGNPGFSPRNVRRMRDFYRAYENNPDLEAEALEIGWTQNVLIFESCESNQERAWYLQAARRFGWTKQVLAQKINEQAGSVPFACIIEKVMGREGRLFSNLCAGFSDCVQKCFPFHKTRSRTLPTGSCYRRELHHVL